MCETRALVYLITCSISYTVSAGETVQKLRRDWMGTGLTFKMTMTNRSVTTSGRLATNCESLAWSEVARLPRRRKYENGPGTISKAISSLFLHEQWWWNVLSYNVSLLTHSSSVILYLLLFSLNFLLFCSISSLLFQSFRLSWHFTLMLCFHSRCLFCIPWNLAKFHTPLFLLVILYPCSLFLTILWRSRMAKCQIFQKIFWYCNKSTLLLQKQKRFL